MVSFGHQENFVTIFWCQKLSVPGLDLVVYNTILRNSKNPEQFYCNKLSQTTFPTNSVFGKSKGFYIAVKSQAIARMQSPVLDSTTLLSSNDIEGIINFTPADDSGSNDGDDGNGGGDDGNGGGDDGNDGGDDGNNGGDDGNNGGDDGNGGGDDGDDNNDECPPGQVPGAIGGCAPDDVHCALNPTDPICPCTDDTTVLDNLINDPSLPSSPAEYFSPIQNN